MPSANSFPEISAVLFDVDGTLVDTLATIVRGLGDAFERFSGNRPTDEVIRSLIGLPLTKQLQLFSMRRPTEQEMSERIDFAISQFDRYKHLEEPFVPAVSALVLLQGRGFKIGLVTSKSQVEVESFLSRFDAAAFVDAVVCSSDVSKPKPDAESALLACERLGIRPEQAILIGDSIFDMQCAKNAGLAAAIAVSYGAGDREALLAEDPDFIFETPDELLEWANNLSKTPCLDARS